MYRFAQIFAGLAGIIHVLFFFMESIAWMKPEVHSIFQVQTIEDAELLRIYIQNQGFYNLFLACGIFVGLFIARRNPTASRALLIYACLFMIGAAIVLNFTIPAMIKGVFIQGLPPLIALIFLMLHKKN